MTEIFNGVLGLQLGNIIMFVIAGILIYLAIAKEYEPTLLLPIGFGAILANIPFPQLSAKKAYLPCYMMLESKLSFSRY
jgi:oxaloacetate decarboxylase beta subunit